MVPTTNGVEDRVAIEGFGLEAGQTAERTEEGGAGIACAHPALMAVGIADDANAVVLVESIMKEPFESTPGGMNLDRLFEPPIVRECDVRITSTAMGIHDAILAL